MGELEEFLENLRSRASQQNLFGRGAKVYVEEFDTRKVDWKEIERKAAVRAKESAAHWERVNEGQARKWELEDWKSRNSIEVSTDPVSIQSTRDYAEEAGFDDPREYLETLLEPPPVPLSDLISDMYDAVQENLRRHRD